MNIDKPKDFNEIKGDLILEIKGIRLDINRYMAMVDTHEKALYGDKVKEPGAMEDLRNLKTIEATRQKHHLFLYTAVIGGLIERAFHYLTGHGPK